MNAFHHILIPTDFGESSAAAERLAVELAAKFGSHITLAHVLEPPMPFDGPFPQPIRNLGAPVEKDLDDALAQLKMHHADSDRCFTVGTPWEQILSVAKDRGVDLIAMGTHGRRGLVRAVLGSVAEKVVRLSPVPVLTVHAA